MLGQTLSSAAWNYPICFHPRPPINPRTVIFIVGFLSVGYGESGVLKDNCPTARTGRRDQCNVTWFRSLHYFIHSHVCTADPCNVVEPRWAN